jgi:hypothetical protein
VGSAPSRKTRTPSAAKQAWMVNFRVRHLDAMVAQLRAAGITVEMNTRMAALPVCATPRAIRLSCGSPPNETLRARVLPDDTIQSLLDN